MKPINSLRRLWSAILTSQGSMRTYPHPLVGGHVCGPWVTPACQVDRHALSLNELPQLLWPPHLSCVTACSDPYEGAQQGGTSPANDELSRNQLEVGMKSMGCCHSPTCRHSLTDVCVRSASLQLLAPLCHPDKGFRRKGWAKRYSFGSLRKMFYWKAFALVTFVIFVLVKSGWRLFLYYILKGIV